MCPDNEKMKKRYEKHLIGAEEAAVLTVDQYLRAINMLDRCNNYLDFRKYDVDNILKFKEKASNIKWKGNCVSPRTTRTYLLHNQKFFKWLCIQPGYKQSKILILVAYFKPSRLEDNASSSSDVTDVPDIDYVLKLCNSIKITCEIDLRDRAIIEFLLLTGLRIGAFISLPFGCIEQDTLIINQNPSKNVKTKNSKPILSILFPFNKILVGYFKTYLELLRSLEFKPEEPLFPKSKIEYNPKTNIFENPGKLSREFWGWRMGVSKMLGRRCAGAGLKYHSPHKYRHGTTKILYDSGLDISEVKAMSQSLGHKKISTTLAHYGNYNYLELKSKLISMKFDQNRIDNSELASEIQKVAEYLKKLDDSLEDLRKPK